MNNDFEEAFCSFLERREYDEAESALFSMVRTAFLAGWKSAGGEPPVPQKLFEVIRCGTDHPDGHVERHSGPRQICKTSDLTLKKPIDTILAEMPDGSRMEFPLPANAPMGTEPVRCLDCAVPSLVGLSGGMEAVDLLARKLAGMEPKELTVYKALLEATDCYDLQIATLLVDTLDQYILSPQFSSPVEVAREEIDTLCDLETEMLMPYVDLYEYGQALIRNCGGVMTPYGLIERVDRQPVQGMEIKSAQGEMTMQ